MVVGPCTPYVTGAEVAQRIGGTPDATVCAALAVEVSETLYVLTGRQYPGICQAKARPRRQDPEPFYGMPNFEGRGAIYDWAGPWGPGWGYNFGLGCCDKPVVLPDFLRSVDEVKVDGIPQVEGTDYYLDGNALHPIGKSFPGWQKLWLPDTDPGTFSVVYTYGPDTPGFMRRAALDYADYLYLLDGIDTTCQYPQGTTSVTRQGQTVNINDRVAEARAAGPVLPSLNSAIGLANPLNQRAPADLYSHHDAWRLVIQALETGS